MMKKNKIIYWVATAIMILVFSFSAGMYLFSYGRASGFFIHLGFPTWLIYPLAILKILGIMVILLKKSYFLKELAYAGFLFDALLAFSAHTVANDGSSAMSIIAIVATIVSWIYDRKVFPRVKYKFNYFAKI
ncbi:DoxX family protein [Aquimarina sp. ERC-38]|uniref:DoxX family protein n=1 Tax=Aquimarina sp. ERC-38 TaxID=2949996 RepID=UPI0022450784|nr:DoxX family protein [Aquimarina sp. ERC-38]UZO82231.1 DoxX family protein [Aquimarina sp. ERC-38]